MQMKVPYPNNTEDNTITQLMVRKSTIFNTSRSILAIILGEQICALRAKFSNTLSRRLQ